MWKWQGTWLDIVWCAGCMCSIMLKFWNKWLLTSLHYDAGISAFGAECRALKCTKNWILGLHYCTAFPPAQMKEGNRFILEITQPLLLENFSNSSLESWRTLKVSLKIQQERSTIECSILGLLCCRSCRKFYNFRRRNKRSAKTTRGTRLVVYRWKCWNGLVGRAGACMWSLIVPNVRINLMKKRCLTHRKST